MPYYATNILVQHVIRIAGRWGVSSQEILEHVKLSERDAFRPGGMVPTPQMFDALEFAAVRSGQPDFGIQLGENIPDGIIAGIGILLSHCTTLGQATDDIGRFFHLINSAVVIQSTPHEGGRKVQFHILCQGRHELRHLGEMQALLFRRIGQFLAGGSFATTRMHLPLPALSDAKRYEEALGCPVFHGTGECAGFVAREDMSRPIAMNREHLHALVQKTFESLSRDKTRDIEDFPKRVEGVVRKLLASGNTSSAAVANALNLSTRSLQRRLAAEGSSLRAIISVERERLEASRRAARSISSKKV
jgi:AraC-like DNA-binding protein